MRDGVPAEQACLCKENLFQERTRQDRKVKHWQEISVVGLHYKNCSEGSCSRRRGANCSYREDKVCSGGEEAVEDGIVLVEEQGECLELALVNLASRCVAAIAGTVRTATGRRLPRREKERP